MEPVYAIRVVLNCAMPVLDLNPANNRVMQPIICRKSALKHAVVCPIGIERSILIEVQDRAPRSG